MHTKPFLQRLLLVLTVLLIALQPLFALAEQADEAPVTHIGRATVALKVRRAPEKNALGCDSIDRDGFAYIVEMGDEWCKVRTRRNEGYVQTKYLTDIRPYDSASFVAEEAAPAESAPDAPRPGFETTEDTFREGYIAHAVKAAPLYAEPDERSRRAASVPQYKQVTVSEVSGEWAFVRYQNRMGYMRVNTLFKWDRIDPYIGEIPGQDIWPYLAFVNHTTTIYSTEDGSVLKTINPGAAVCVGEPDSQGRYPLPYWRTTGYITADDIAWLMPVADWENAQSGDLISVMTTYFAVGVSTLQYQGRNWNIHLAASTITGTVLQPGETYNQNKTIGPYAKSTGYHKAPIMSPHALWGYGGGTCQVNTTFYIATIRLPLLVTHRKVHADVGIYYAKKGFDAAVGGGDINLTMQNTLPYAIRYQFFISDGVLTCCIFKD